MGQRWFLSYHSPDHALARKLKAALERKVPDARVFFAPEELRAGGFWSAQLAREIADANAFVLLVGEHGVGNWQVLEYDEALDRRVNCPDFPVVLVLLEGRTAPGFQFLRRLHWVVTPDPASDLTIARLLDAASGVGQGAGELWRHVSPYRGLPAMDERDSDYFFGRGREIVEVVTTLAAAPDKLPVLIGNSGVGKSSLAQAGVIAALMRQGWPEATANPGPWPVAFQESRRWCFLTMRPGDEPVRSLVEAFLDTWQLDSTSTDWPKKRTAWTEELLAGRLGLADLLDQTKRRHAELGLPEPGKFFLYIDQGEELYARAGERQRLRFSELVGRSVADPRVHGLMSLRADFFGDLQRDEPLYAAYRLISVPPLRESELGEVVSRPAALLGARFDTDTLAADIARRAADESTRDAGALPLLSYLLDDMWRRMVERGDRVLRLPAQAIDLEGVLAERADAFLAAEPGAEDAIRRIFTLKLANVREDGEPTKRRARRSEFDKEEWRLVTRLADHPSRLLVTATRETGEAYAEVAHETIFRRWKKLSEWIAGQREFLAWRTGLEAARRAWSEAPARSKLLMGFALKLARSWLARHPEGVRKVDRDFVARSRRAEVLRAGALVGGFAAVVTLGLAAWWNQDWLKEEIYALLNATPLTAERERALKAGDSFKECSDCPAMIVVPAGRFMMGSPEGQGGDSERPRRDVKIVRPFAVAEFELTFDEWDACAAHGDCDTHVLASDWGRGRRPAINVSWDGAQTYVKWLSRITGKQYRLLSEAEYEYAARAGTETKYPWGDEIKLNGQAMANCDGCGSQWDRKQTAPVGSFAANRFGLYDMVGNVWEWTEDCYHEGYQGAPGGGSPWTSDDCSMHVVRGSNWNFNSDLVRSAGRAGLITGGWGPDLGFRVAGTLSPQH